MEHRQFGTTDCKVSPMGLGCLSMSGMYGAGDDEESIATLHRAFELGINFLDTSASYGNGHNHELIGKGLAACWRRALVECGVNASPDRFEESPALSSVVEKTEAVVDTECP